MSGTVVDGGHQVPLPTERDLIDLVDDDDQVIGTIRRDRALRPGHGFRVAHLLAANTSEELLLQQIGEQRTRHPGQWGSSVAAYVRAGESPESAVRRRMLEEIGLQSDLVFLGRTAMLDRGARKFIYVYGTTVDGVPEIRDHGRVAQLEFWSRAAIAKARKGGADVFTATLACILGLDDRHLVAE